MKYYSYDEFRQDTKQLVESVKPLHIDMVLGIARGGLTLAHCVSEGLGLRDVQTLRTELYDNQTKRKNITIHSTCNFENVKKVLVVDDIADSGETLKAVMDYLCKNNLHVKFISATLFYKKTSVYKPDFWVQETTAWIDFFWERDYILL